MKFKLNIFLKNGKKIVWVGKENDNTLTFYENIASDEQGKRIHIPHSGISYWVEE